MESVPQLPMTIIPGPGPRPRLVKELLVGHDFTASWHFSSWSGTVGCLWMQPPMLDCDMSTPLELLL